MSTKKEMNINDLYITNYREAGGLPLHNIARLPKEEAYAFAKTLSQKSISKRDRYGDYFDTYYHKGCGQRNGCMTHSYL